MGNTRLELVTSSMSSSLRGFLGIDDLEKPNDLCVLCFIYFIISIGFWKNGTYVAHNSSETPTCERYFLHCWIAKRRSDGISKSVATNSNN